MVDHYERLRVPRDASKEEIREAYLARRDELSDQAGEEVRAELGGLNEAWQTLADPYQRGRYDASLGEDAPAHGPDVIEPDGEGERRRRPFEPPSGGRRPQLQPTIALPPGMQFPETRARVNAMLFDLALLILVFMGVQLLGESIVRDRYPEQIDQLDALSDQVDVLDDERADARDARDSVRDEVSDLERQLAAAEEAGRPTAPLEDELDDRRAALAEAEDEVETLDARREELEDEASEVAEDLAPARLLVFASAIALGLVYLVGTSVRTGKTLGKRLRRIRVVHVDGSPLTFRGAVLRYGTPAVFFLLVVQLLGFLGLGLALLGVLMWLRNPNQQGLHDRLARTIVVADAPAGAGGAQGAR